MANSMTKVASGNVSPCRFVKLDTTADGKCLQATAGDKIFGISGPGTRNAPLLGWDDGYHAIAGENVHIFGFDDICLLEMAASGSPGDRISADSNGKGVQAATDTEEYGAILEEATASGKLAKVRVRPTSQFGLLPPPPPPPGP